VYASTLNPGNIQSAFRKSGIYPFDKSVIEDAKVAPATSFDRDSISATDAPDPTSHTPVNETSKSAESFLLNRGGKILQNVKKAKIRNTLSKIVGGKCITENEVFDKIIDHDTKQSSKNKQTKKTNKANPVKGKRKKNIEPSTSGIQTKKMTLNENFSSSESEIDEETDKCIVCKSFYPDSSKKPQLLIVNWGQCDTCKGWVHLSFCSSVRVIRRGDKFLCPFCCDTSN
jgi:hypothetical protein